MVHKAGMFRSSESDTHGNDGAVSVEDAEGVSDGEDVDQMKPQVHAGCNHLGSITAAGRCTGAVLHLMTCPTLATYVFVLTCFCCALPQVPFFADWCVGISNVLGTFVSTL